MARKLISTKDLSYEDWLNLRNKSIGGSDCATILGLNKFKSPYSLWAEKKGFVPIIDKDTEIMKQGRDLESYVAQRFCEETGKKVKRRNYIFLHDEYDFISANIDREIVGENAGLECKTTSIYNKANFENGEIPPYYYCQCMHYMSVMGYDKMYLAVLILSKGFYWFEISRNNKEIEVLIKEEIEFWKKYILGKEVPQIDGSIETLETIQKMQKDINTGTIQDLSNIEDTLEEYYKILKQKKYLETQEKTLKNNIIAQIGNSELGNSKSFNVSYKTQFRKSLNSNLLKKEEPEIFKKYSKETEFRTLKLKKVE